MSDALREALEVLVAKWHERAHLHRVGKKRVASADAIEYCARELLAALRAPTPEDVTPGFVSMGVDVNGDAIIRPAPTLPEGPSERLRNLVSVLEDVCTGRCNPPPHVGEWCWPCVVQREVSEVLRALSEPPRDARAHETTP